MEIFLPITSSAVPVGLLGAGIPNSGWCLERFSDDGIVGALDDGRKRRPSLFGPFPLGDVPGSGKDPGDGTPVVHENRGDIKYGGYMAVPVPDLQFIIGDRTIPEYGLYPAFASQDR